MKSIADIKAIKEKMQSVMELRNVGAKANAVSPYKHQILICGGTGCHSNSSGKIIDEFNKQIKERGLEKDVLIVQTGCFGLCAVGPVVIVYPENAFYSKITVEDVKEIVDEHLVNGKIVEKFLHGEALGQKVVSLPETE